MADPQLTRREVALWGLLVVFVLRVLGQLLVAMGRAPFLPPMEEWFSGVMPYPPLLFSQALSILVYTKVCVDFTRRRGYFVVPRKRLGFSLVGFGSTYLAVMVIRYVIRMSLYPQERWTGGSIPIFFHWVLAGFLLTVGQYHWTRTRKTVRQRRLRSGARRRLQRAGELAAAAGLGACLLGWVGYQLAPSALARDRKSVV